MSSELLSRNNLLLALAITLIAKFIVMPVWIWQNEQLEVLRVKNIKLSKLSSVISNYKNLQLQLSETEKDIQSLTKLFFQDQETIKLSIQKQIEKTFENNSVKIEAFNWVFDSGNDVVRSLRASIQYSGSTENTIRTLWDLFHTPQVINQVEWRSRISAEDGSLGLSNGNLTLEFFSYTAAVSTTTSDESESGGS